MLAADGISLLHRDDHDHDGDDDDHDGDEGKLRRKKFYLQICKDCFVIARCFFRKTACKCESHCTTVWC